MLLVQSALQFLVQKVYSIGMVVSSEVRSKSLTTHLTVLSITLFRRCLVSFETSKFILHHNYEQIYSKDEN
jgi:hypothetical protein